MRAGGLPFCVFRFGGFGEDCGLAMAADDLDDRGTTLCGTKFKVLIAAICGQDSNALGRIATVLPGTVSHPWSHHLSTPLQEKWGGKALNCGFKTTRAVMGSFMAYTSPAH